MAVSSIFSLFKKITKTMYLLGFNSSFKSRKFPDLQIMGRTLIPPTWKTIYALVVKGIIKQVIKKKKKKKTTLQEGKQKRVKRSYSSSQLKHAPPLPSRTQSSLLTPCKLVVNSRMLILTFS